MDWFTFSVIVCCTLWIGLLPLSLLVVLCGLVYANLIKISPFISLSVCFCRSWKDLTQPRLRHVLVTFCHYLLYFVDWFTSSVVTCGILFLVLCGLVYVLCNYVLYFVGWFTSSVVTCSTLVLVLCGLVYEWSLRPGVHQNSTGGTVPPSWALRRVLIS